MQKVAKRVNLSDGRKKTASLIKLSFSVFQDFKMKIQCWRRFLSIRKMFLLFLFHLVIGEMIEMKHDCLSPDIVLISSISYIMTLLGALRRRGWRVQVLLMCYHPNHTLPNSHSGAAWVSLCVTQACTINCYQSICRSPINIDLSWMTLHYNALCSIALCQQLLCVESKW